MGMERFISMSAESGISGLIIPDIPFDERNENYLQLAEKHGLYPIQVVSPDVKLKRLKQILTRAKGFIYTTLKIGITGARKQIDQDGLQFINTIRKETSIPIAAGFGISSPKQVEQLCGKSDAAVIGSHMINLFNQSGTAKIKDFLNQCTRVKKL